MKCGNPVLALTANGKKVYRHWKLASQLFRATATPISGCGKCLHCRKKSSSELAMRCVLHASLYEDNIFITATYDEKKPGYHNQLCYTDIQNFKKRLRRHCDRENKKIEIFNVHEYGKNGKKHWHLIVFNHDFKDKKIYSKKNGNNLYTSKTLEKLWKHGFVTIGDVTEASAMYQAQYMEKDIKNGNNQFNGKASKSNHSGLGKKYFEKNYAQILQLGYVPFSNHRRPVPRYFEKLAHKHWAHFNDQSYFHDLPDRKKRYTKFKPGEAKEEMSRLYEYYVKNHKQPRVSKMEIEWDQTVDDYLKTGVQPEFVQSLKNTEYNTNNKTKKEKF